MIAIIIPYYKSESFENLLKSLIAQTNKNFNVYIGDDASPEDPTSIIEAYKNKLHLTYVRFDKNLGSTSLVKQWERCIALKQDEPWMTILGDDDYYEPTVIATFYKHLQQFENKSNVVRFATKTRFVEDNKLTVSFKHPLWETAPISYYRKFKGKTRSSLSEYFFKSNVCLKYGFTDYPLAWYSDDKAWFDFSENKPIYSINDASVVISVSNQSITGMTNNKMEKFKAQKAFYKSLVSNYNYKLSRDMRLDYLRAFEAVSRRLNVFTLSDKKIVLKQFFTYFAWLTLVKFLKRQIKE